MLHEVVVEVFEIEVATLEVDHWAGFHLLVDHKERWNAGCASHVGVVGTKGRSDVHDTCTVVGGHIVARDYAEAVVVAHDFTVDFVNRLHPWEQLFVLHAHEFGTCKFGNHLVRNHLVALLVAVECEFCAFGSEVGVEASLCQNVGGRFAGVWVVAFHSHIVNLRANAERGVGRQGPRSGGPSDDAEVFKTSVHLAQNVGNNLVVVFLHCKLCSYGLVFNVAVATWLVQLVAAQTGASGR